MSGGGFDRRLWCACHTIELADDHAPVSAGGMVHSSMLCCLKVARLPAVQGPAHRAEVVTPAMIALSVLSTAGLFALFAVMLYGWWVG